MIGEDMGRDDGDRAIEQFFAGRPDARGIFDALSAMITSIDGVDVSVTNNQIAFARRRAFAWAWTPDRWLRGNTAPLVLSVALSRRDPSSRWKEVVEPRRGRWMHHLELRSVEAVDDDVQRWLAEAAHEAA